MHSVVLLVWCLLLVTMTTGSHVPSTCARDYYKLGCYIDNHYPRSLPALLFTDRDPFSPNFQQTVDWKNWDQYMHSLACRCESKARSYNYTMFGLQYYGECWAGLGSCDTYKRLGESQMCYGSNYTQCDNDADFECVGGPYANYVYLITE